MFEVQPSRVFIDTQSHHDDIYITMSVREGHGEPRYIVITGVYDIMWEMSYCLQGKSPLLTEEDILLIIQNIQADYTHRKGVLSILIGLINDKSKISTI